MAVGDYELVGRAARILRVAPEPGWQEIESDVIAAVRAIPRGGWPLAVADPGPPGARGVIRVSDLVLTGLLSRSLASDPDYIVLDIRAFSEDEVLQAVSIDLACRYLSDAPAAAQRARARSADVVDAVVGRTAAVSIDVTVTDVYR